MMFSSIMVRKDRGLSDVVFKSGDCSYNIIINPDDSIHGDFI